MKGGILRSVIGDRDFPKNVVRGAFRNFLLDIKKAISLKNARILQLIFTLVATAPAVF